MKKLNKKGFTLIEVLAVIAIIAILGLVSTPGVLNAINNSKKSNYNILLENIKSAGTSLYEEVDLGNKVYHYNQDGTKGTLIVINSASSTIEVSLQTLVNSGLLKGVINETNSANKNKTILLHPVSDIDIGECRIKINKKVDATTYKTTYEVTSATNNSSCPTTEDFMNGV